jgi:hypothetical protein
MQRGVAWLHQKAIAAAGESVVYIRGNGARTVIIAIPSARRALEQYVNEEATITADPILWRISPEDMVIDFENVPPTVGDVIEWTLKGTVLTFEVLPADGQQADSSGDAYGNWIRVETKLIDSRPV